LAACYELAARFALAARSGRSCSDLGALISFGLLALESQGDDDNEDHVPYSPMSQEAAQEEVRRSISKTRPPLPLHTCVSRHTLCTARLAWLGQSNRKASYSVLCRSSAPPFYSRLYCIRGTHAASNMLVLTGGARRITLLHRLLILPSITRLCRLPCRRCS